jgi:hypothetical protein
MKCGVLFYKTKENLDFSCKSIFFCGTPNGCPKNFGQQKSGRKRGFLAESQWLKWTVVILYFFKNKKSRVLLKFYLF